ncbi:MAG: hypothetical protein LBV72_17585 [Tannerella sp.]|nr:hypothetical protein [Tannerella sp.]
MLKVRSAFLILIISSFSMMVCSQTDGGVKIMPKQGELYESTKQLNNPFILPAWGKRLGKRGFLLPYPIGIMVNSYIGEQDVAISDLTIGINDADGNVIIPTTSLDQVVGFSKVKASVRNINARADIWVLPFLDVYGIFGKAWVETKVGIGSIANRPVDISTEADFSGYVYGIGAMLTGGVRSIFFSLDFNTVWTHFDEMKKNNSAMNFAPRVGYIFHFNNQPERNFSLWTGASRTFLNSTTVGSLVLSDIAPDLGQNYENSDWYNGLSPTVQKIADNVVENFVDKNKGDIINYSLNKRPEHNWCMILGAQYQINRHWQFRVETNFLGGRKSGLISANYRFGIFK